MEGDNMLLPKESTYIIDDIYALPEGERAELIDGHIYYMAPPSTKHQRISSFISWKISDYIHTNHGKCEVFTAPFAVHLDETSTTYVEPDISVICDPNKLNDKGCMGSPDWMRSYLLQVKEWIIIQNCSSTELPVSVNIGLLTRPRIRL